MVGNAIRFKTAKTVHTGFAQERKQLSMRGPSKSLPKYRKHRPSGKAVVTLSGRDYYLGPHGTKASKIEYDRLIGEWLANGRQLPTIVESKPISIVKLCSNYWVFCRSYYVKNGKATDEQAGVKAAIRYLNQTYGKTAAIDFGPLALEAVRQQMIEAGNSRRYINQNIGRIKRMFRWAVSKELVPAKAHQRLQSVSGLKKGKSNAKETDPILPIDDSTVSATLQFLNKTVSDMVRIQRLTGCRPGEVCSMRPMEINRTGEVWQYWPESHKMEHKERSRVVLIGPQAQAILEKYLLKPESEYCFLREEQKPYERSHYYQHISRACDKAFPADEEVLGDALNAWKKKHRWAPNRLRHSAGTDIRSKFGLEASTVVLGHSKIETTQIYAERDLEKAAKIMAEIG